MDEQAKFPSYEAFSKILGEDIADANRNVTHADFVVGVHNRTMGFKCMVGEPHQLLSGARRTVFNILVLLYWVAPFVLAPLWAWREHNWWLLLGIPVSAIGTFIATSLIYNPARQPSIASFILMAFVASWIFEGFHSYPTFFLLSALWGFVLFMIADNVEREYAMQSLVEDPQLFKQAIAQKKIMIVRKE